MNRMTKLKCLFKYISVVIFILLVSCAQRNEDTKSRNNPFDPGAGEVWTRNANPVLTVQSDSLWEDFNYSGRTGSLRLHVQADDLNFPYDSLSGTILVNQNEIKLPVFKHTYDTSILLSNIKPGTVPSCSVAISDSKGGFISRSLIMKVPQNAPPYPPSASIFNSVQNVKITWMGDLLTDYYILHIATNLKGPYTDSVIVKRTNSNLHTFIDSASGYTPRYYILSAANLSGRSQSTDTLIGRKYSFNSITPSISSISQGSYTMHIMLTCYISSYTNIDHLEIYRSENDSSSFRIARTVKVSNNNYIYYYDSVPTSRVYYYKITAVNKQGECSYPSAVKYGYIASLSNPSADYTLYYDYIRLNWNSVYNAVKYKVYRSGIGCNDASELLCTTTLTTISDTPPNGDIYYYTFSSVDNKGREGTIGGCIKARILGLPNPDSINVSKNIYPRHVALAWRAVSGATGYVIYRDSTNSGSAAKIIDTVFVTSYIDSVKNSSTYYYRIAGLNEKGIGQPSGSFEGSAIVPLIQNAQGNFDSLSITIAPQANAIAYFIYRSHDTTSMVLIDSTTTAFYNVPLSDFNPYYYQVTIRTPEGVSYPSRVVYVKQHLKTPSNVILTSNFTGVQIRWNKVAGAEIYDIYRADRARYNTLYSSTTDTIFNDTLLSSSGGFYYKIGARNSSTSSSISTYVYGGRISPPQVPSNFSAQGQANSIYLKWGISSGSSRPDGFRIYRSTDNSIYRLIDSTKIFLYYDTVPDISTYYYRITSYNLIGESSQSVTCSAALTKPAAPTNGSYQ